jgi:predicted GIY-YIG superfamily endonuclease
MKEEFGFFTYILVSGKTGGYYTGQTNDIEDRLRGCYIGQTKNHLLL